MHKGECEENKERQLVRLEPGDENLGNLLVLIAIFTVK